MTNFFIGIYPDERTNHMLKGLTARLGSLFDSQQLPANFVKPETFHITLRYLGKDLSLPQRALMGFQLRTLRVKADLKLGTGKVSVGLGRRYRELAYLSIENGADKLREVAYEIGQKLAIPDDRPFVPHISIARIKKQLTDQEYRNLRQSINEEINKSISVSEFAVNQFCLIRSDQGVHTVLKKFSI